MRETDGWVLSELERIYAEMQRMMREMVSPEQWDAIQQHRGFRPPTDVYETDTHAVVRMEVAGINPNEARISYTNRVLTVVGHRSDPAEKLAYQQMEIRYGDFRRDVLIPWPVDEDHIQANYEDGFLVILLPKKKPHRVAITAQEES
jgi:HSP20 family protein